jgi:glycosyltransferase involved in cell wall biosynthesis
VTELPAHYVASDVLLHPSGADHHPLAISEAITCGLPCIVSDRVGSVGPTDDIRPGINGWEYPVGDYLKLASRIRELVLDPELLRTTSDNSFRIARERGMDQSLRGFLAAVHHICGEPQGKAA